MIPIKDNCVQTNDYLPDPISPRFSIVHRSRGVFQAISCVSTELWYIDSSWSSCLCTSMWRGLQEYVNYEFVLTSPVVPRMSGSSNFDRFRDGWQVAVHLLFCVVRPPGLVQYGSQYFCVIAVKFFSISLDSVYVVHPYSSIDTITAWKNCVLFYRSGLSSIWPIADRWLSMPLLVAYWCLSRLMTHYFLGRLICPLVSENNYLVWICRLFD